MKPAFTFDEIRQVEKTIIEKDGVPSLVLMENAGKNAFDILCIKYPDIADYSICIFCGKGNNAGDGFVIARQMALNGIDVNIINVCDVSELKGDALSNYSILKAIKSDKISFISFNEFAASKQPPLKKGKTLIIDALLGSGVNGRLSRDFESAISCINSAKDKNKKLQVVSVDVPSGLMSGEQINPLVNADLTITMGTVKTELLFGAGKENSGEIFVAAIGIDDDTLNRYNNYSKYIVGHEDIPFIFPKRKKTSYKYSNGRVLLIGGSKGLSGAIIMSAMAAAKAGAGAATVAYPKSLSSHFGRKLFDLTKVELDETPEGSITADSFGAIKKKIEWSDAVLIGPGISLNNETKNFVFDVIRNCSKNIVIDADALTLLAEDMSVLSNRKASNEVILTPHLGEFSRLSSLSTEEIINNRFESVSNFAKKYNVNVLMKSETPFTCLKNGEVYFNTSGNELLAVTGSGDVLSGILVSLLAQTGDSKTAMICGNYLHGMLAEMYYEKYGNKQSAMQRDLIKFIPGAVTKIIN
jgi:ADP-dependent NAD(P)H-hydrate dehydratase / NAD(P)H-hydrate epimerase